MVYFFSDNLPPNSNSHLKLAKKYFQLHVDEIKSRIFDQENKFRSLVKEIQSLNSNQPHSTARDQSSISFDQSMSAEPAIHPEPSTSGEPSVDPDQSMSVEPSINLEKPMSVEPCNDPEISINVDQPINTEPSIDQELSPIPPKSEISFSNSPDFDNEDSRPSNKRRKINDSHDSQVQKKAQKFLLHLLSEITAHKAGTLFSQPIKENEAPGYHDIIYHPIDLATIKKKIRDGTIPSTDQFSRDILRMFANCIMYNPPSSDIYGMAQEMMVATENLITSFKQTDSHI